MADIYVYNMNYGIGDDYSRYLLPEPFRDPEPWRVEAPGKIKAFKTYDEVLEALNQ